MAANHFDLLRYFSSLERQIISPWRAKIFFQRDRPFITDRTVKNRLNGLADMGLITPIKRGVKSLWHADTPYINQTNNIYELANEAYPIGSLCYSTALEALKLSDQRFNKIHILLPSETVTNLFNEEDELRNNLMPPDTELEDWQINKAPSNIKIKEVWGNYTLFPHKIKNEWLFGTELREVEGVKVRTSTLERALIDGLKIPKYCGGLNEVFRAWVRALDTIDINQLVGYTQKYDRSILYQRVGFVAETLGLFHKKFDDWKENKSPRGGSRLLNPYKEYKDTFDPEWNISINHSISILRNKDADYS